MTDTETVIASTIVPTVGRDTLRRAVQSALDQGLDRAIHEVIVVNDSGQPLEAQRWLADRSVRVVDADRSGLGAACNAGADAARGKYLQFLHDDDLLMPDGLRALIQRA